MGLAPGVSFANDFGYSFGAAIGYLPFWPILVGGLYKFYVLIGSPSRFVYYFLIKQPIIISDVLVAYYLYRYVEKRGSDKASFVMKVWLFSPFKHHSLGDLGHVRLHRRPLRAARAPGAAGAYRGFWAGVATFAKSIPVLYAIPLSKVPIR